MDLTTRAVPARSATTRLVVADWSIDPQPVLATVRRRPAAVLRIVVPAWLHGLDWAGDPRASVPCAQRQLERITQLCSAAGLHVEGGAVGDPDPLTAIDDAVARGGVDEILLFARGRHLASGYPLSVANRAERLTGLPVQRISVPRVARPPRRWRSVGGLCELARPQAS
jgi:hypothetical protein